MADFFTSAGTTISLSAAQPATYNEAGYEALTWTVIGGVTDLGALPKKMHEIVTQYFVASRGAVKMKGGYDLGSQTITYAVTPADPGQDLVDTANESDAKYSVKVSNPNVGEIYAQALVAAGELSYGDVNSPVTQAATLHYTIVSDTEDGLVTVAAA